MRFEGGIILSHAHNAHRTNLGTLRGVGAFITAGLAVVCTVFATANQRSSNKNVVRSEEYAVYSAVANKMAVSAGVKLIVVKDKTTGSRYVNPELLKNGKLKERLAPLMQETVDDFVAKNREARQLSRDFDIKLPYIFFTEIDDGFFKQQDAWEAFSKKFPGAFGYIAFSAVGFNPEMSQALLFFEHYCGRLCGAGYLVVLTKHEGTWDPLKPLMLWIS